MYSFDTKSGLMVATLLAYTVIEPSVPFSTIVSLHDTASYSLGSCFGYVVRV